MTAGSWPASVPDGSDEGNSWESMNHDKQRSIRMNGHRIDINDRLGRWRGEQWTVWRDTDGRYSAVDYSGRAVYYDLPTLDDALMAVAPADDVKAVLADAAARQGETG